MKKNIGHDSGITFFSFSDSWEQTQRSTRPMLVYYNKRVGTASQSSLSDRAFRGLTMDNSCLQETAKMNTNDILMLSLYELFNSIRVGSLKFLMPSIYDFRGHEQTNQELLYSFTSYKEEMSANDFGILRVRRRYLIQSAHSLARNDIIYKPKFGQAVRQYAWTRMENTFCSDNGIDLPFLHAREELLGVSNKMVLQTFYFAVNSSYNDIFEICLDTVYQFVEFANTPLLFTLKNLHCIYNSERKFAHSLNLPMIRRLMYDYNKQLCIENDNLPFSEMMEESMNLWIQNNRDLAENNFLYMDIPYLHYYDPPISRSFEHKNCNQSFNDCNVCNEAQIQYYNYRKEGRSYKSRKREARREHLKLEMTRTFSSTSSESHEGDTDLDVPLFKQGGSYRRVNNVLFLPDLQSDSDSEYSLEEGEIDSDEEIDLHPQMNLLPSFGISESKEGFDNLMKEIMEIMPKFSNAADSIAETTQKANSILEKYDTPDVRKEILNFLKDVKGGMDIKGVVKDVYSTGAILFLLSCVVNCALYRDRHSLYYLGIGVVACLMFASDKVASVVNYMCSVLKFDTIVPQSMQDFDLVLTGATAVLTSMVVGCTSIKYMPKEIVMMMVQFPRVKQTIKDIFFFFYDITRTILKYFDMGAWMSNLGHIKYGNESIRNMIDEVEKIQEEIGRSKFYIDEKNFIRITVLIKAFRALQLDVPRDSKTSGLHSAITDFLHKLDGIRVLFGNSQFGFTGVRNEPFNVMLVGGPGTLKSELKEYVAEAVMQMVGDEELLERRKYDKTAGVYNCTPEVAYHDSYQPGTVLTVMDDLFQTVDVPGMTPNEKFLFMRMGNMNPFALECAAIHNKGNTFFSSDCIIATSNAWRISSEAIVDVRAVVRRFHLAVVVHPKPEFRTEETMYHHPMEQKFKIEAFPKGHLGETKVDPDMFMFSEVNLLEQKLTGHLYTFDEIILTTKLEIDRRKIWMKQRSKELDDMAEKYSRIKNFYLKRDDLGMVDVEETIRNLKTFSFDDDLPMPKDIVPEECYLYKQALDFSQFNLSGLHNDDLNEFDIELDNNCINIVDYIYSDMNIDEERRLTELQIQHQRDMKNVSLKYIIYCYVLAYGEEFLECLSRPGGNILKFFKREFTNFPQPAVRATKWTERSVILIRRYLSELRLPEVPQWMRSGIEFIKENKLFISVSFVTISVTVAALVRRWHKTAAEQDTEPLFVPFDLFPDQQSGYKTRSKSTTASAMKDKLKAKLSKQISGGHDPSGCELVDSIIRRNTWQFGVLQKDHSIFPLGYITFVEGRDALMPNHFMTSLGYDILDDRLSHSSFLAITRYDEKGDKIHQLSFTLGEIMAENKYCQNEMMSKQDLVIVRFPKKVPIHKDIIGNFMKEADSVDLLDQPFRMVVPLPRMKKEFSGRARLRNQVVTEDTSILVGFEYTAHSEQGHCGSLFSIMNPSSPQRKFAGIHVAGNVDKAVGYSAFVTQEMINETRNMLPRDIIRDLEEVPITKQAVDISNGQFLNVCEVVNPCPMALSSEIKKSAIYNKFYISKEAPGKLMPFVNSEGILVDPYLNALSKYGTISKPLPIYLLRLSTNLVFDNLMKESEIKVTKRIYSINEAVQGLEFDSDFGSIPRNTSPGYPLNTERHPGFNKKHFWLGKDEKYDLSKAPGWNEIKEKVELRENKAIKGILVETIYTDNMKDETRSYEKVLIGKTRMFSGSTLDYTILFRRYFGAFCLWIHKNRIDNHCAVGVNPYSEEWNKLSRKFLQFSEEGSVSCGAGDYSGFDSSQVSDILELILLLIQKWYAGTPDEEMVRAVLWEDIMHSVHIRGNIKYEWTNSLPSGNPMTLIINYLYNYICFMYCWVRMTSELPELRTRFHDFVYVIFQGDDQAFSVHPLVRDVFNEQTLVPLLAELGLTYTNESKTQSVVKLRKMTDISFMKRSFRLDDIDNAYVGPLELESIFECLNWTKKKDYFGISRQNVDLAVRELSLHGPIVFEEYIHRLAEVSNEWLNHWPCTTNYRIARSEVRNLESFF